jgi:hypothetical protein
MRLTPRLVATGVALLVSVCTVWLGVPAASAAAAAGPAWAILSVPEPTNFIPGDESSEDARYVVYVTNTGSRATEGSQVTITDDVLPTDVTPVFVEGIDYRNGVAALTCTATPLRCTDSSVIPAGDVIEVVIYVKIGAAAAGEATSAVTVVGGGAPSAAVRTHNPIAAASAPFAIERFDFSALGLAGFPETQAGSHPYAVTTTLNFKTHELTGLARTHYVPAESVKDVVVDLPVGLVGNPLAAPRCPLNELELKDSNHDWGCPPNTKVGEVTLRDILGEAQSSIAAGTVTTSVSPIFNMVAEAGHPAEFAFAVSEIGRVHIFPSIVKTPHGYVLRVTTPGALAELGTGESGFLDGATLTFFGDPGLQDGAGSQPAPFFTNPVDCSAPPPAVEVHVDTWTQPGPTNQDGTPDFSDPRWLSEQVPQPRVTGCESLSFNPAVGFQLTTTEADTPTGATVALQIPQAPSGDAVPATPELKNAVVALPRGVALSPSAANGLEACTAAQFDLEHNATSASCPDGSKIAEAEVSTPLLEEPLRGDLYLATPACGGEGQAECTDSDAADGHLLGVYLQVAGRQPSGAEDGVVVKLQGAVAVDPATGQLTTTFKENPELPFRELTIRLAGGPRAALATPQTCAEPSLPLAVSTDLVPWSTPYTPDAHPSSQPVEIAGCATPHPFAPSFTAGAVTSKAAGFSPFTLTVARSDHNQDFAAVSVTLPVGLIGMLSQVPLCLGPQAQAGTCSEASRIGSTTVAAGSGPDPLWLSGRVYLTGPYNGAPFGLSVVVPAKAGPFNLGDEVVRAAINVDPHTSAITVTSAPLPQMKDGIPLRLKTISVNVDRPGFMVNPTNCEAQTVTATVAGDESAVTGAQSPFAVAGCAKLAFSPAFKVTTQAKTSKANGASLDVKVTSPTNGAANIKAVKVDLPVRLPARLTTLNKACPAATFESNPAQCPPESAVGVVKATTPALPVTLTGPVYLVSHAAEAFPELVAVLQGDGVRVDLAGYTFIKKGVTSSNFASVPDVPVSSFELYLPQGKYSVLTAYGSLCSAPLQMPTRITGQNGAVIKRVTRITVTGCTKATRARRTKTTRAERHAAQRRRRGKRK